MSLAALAMIASIYFNWSYTDILGRDFPREVATPLRLLKGEVLYKDFNFMYGPLPPYLNSWIIKLSMFSVFTTLRILALVLFLLNIFFIWRICCDIQISWIFWPVLFGMVAWTNPTTFNPNSFNLYYSTLFATFGTWCAIRTFSNKKWPWFSLGVMCCFAFLSKPEGFFIVSLAAIGVFAYNWYTYRNIYYRGWLLWFIGFVCVFVSFVVFLFCKGLTCADLIEGIVQQRHQQNMKNIPLDNSGYFFYINHAIVITAGCIYVALIFYLIKLFVERRKYLFAIVLFIVSIFAMVLRNRLFHILNDYQYLGDFFGGILGFWWYRSLPESSLKKGFFVIWFSSLGGWLRPFLHLGAIIVPFRVGGEMLLATLFWLLILPSFFFEFCKVINEKREKILKCFIIIGCVGIIVYGLTGLYYNWNTQWKYTTKKFKTPYGSFWTNSTSENTKMGIAAIDWLQQHLQQGERIVALEGMTIELMMGWLPCIPISQLINQLYPGDTERIIKILEYIKDIKFVLIYIPMDYHFGIQQCELADYLDNKWHKAFQLGIPDSLKKLSLMSLERKKTSGFKGGIIIFQRPS